MSRAARVKEEPECVIIKQEPALDDAVWGDAEPGCVAQELCLKAAACGRETVCVEPGSACAKERPLCVIREVRHVAQGAQSVKNEANRALQPARPRRAGAAASHAEIVSITRACRVPLERARVSGEREREIAFRQLTETVRPRDTYTCEICNRTYKIFTNFITHKQAHLKRKTRQLPRKYKVDPAAFKNTYACEICKEEYNSLAVLKIHRQVHVNKSLKINKKVRASSTLSTELSKDSSKKTHTCSICKAGFDDHIGLKEHALIYHGKAENLYNCEICKLEFSTYRGLQFHNRVHEECRRHSCGRCGERFLQTSTLHRHMLTSHAKGECASAGCETKRAMKQLKRLGRLRKTDVLTYENTDLCEKCSQGDSQP